MNLEVVGRHALLFDDDAMAAFANSSEALVEWNSLSIDRYDVRHLLSSPPPQRRRNHKFDPVLMDELSLEADLDQERYLDLPVPTEQSDLEKDGCQSNADYRSVAFSYGNVDDSAALKDIGSGTGFHPPFPIPEDILSLHKVNLYCKSLHVKLSDAWSRKGLFVICFRTLPPCFLLMPSLGIAGGIRNAEIIVTAEKKIKDGKYYPESDKVHQIIAKTALFVSSHGGQSEIILRVKQGDNPTFGFLMPGHELYAYFRYLVEHPQLLSDSQESSNDHLNNGVLNLNASNSHSSAGALSLLGSVYDSGEEDDVDDNANLKSGVFQGSIEPADQSSSLNSKKAEFKADIEKSESLSKISILNNKDKLHAVKKSSITSSKSDHVKGLDNKPAATDMSNLDIGMKSKSQQSVLEPPYEVKRLITKLVEYVIRNGKQFEAMIIEQDRDHKRFPFLLPSNQFHSYYLRILQDGRQLKFKSKGTSSHKDDNPIAKEKNRSMRRENDFSSSDSGIDGIPVDFEKNEKFKMVINKPKKETSEMESTDIPRESEFTVDAAAAAAILEAATRGIKSSVISRISPVDSCENNSSATSLTKEKKLKAERLKRAKDFVAMLKNREVPLKSGQTRSSSLEPVVSGVLKSSGEDNHDGKERESNAAPADGGGPYSSLKPGTNYFGEENNERILKRKYRSRTEGSEDSVADEGEIKMRSGRDDESENAAGSVHKNRSDGGYSSEREYGDEKSRGDNHHRTKHRSHRVRDNKDEKKSRKKSFSSHEHSRSWEEYESEDENREGKRSRKNHHSNERDKHRSRRDKKSRRSSKHDTQEEESGISNRDSESSRGNATREVSVDPASAPSERGKSADIPDDLRAKIRAMLIATRL